jgi:hypothetical protein
MGEISRTNDGVWVALDGGVNTSDCNHIVAMLIAV